MLKHLVIALKYLLLGLGLMTLSPTLFDSKSAYLSHAIVAAAMALACISINAQACDVCLVSTCELRTI